RCCACLCRMKSHDRLRIVFAQARQNWRAFAYVMQVHENHYTKRAGVAGRALRASSFVLIDNWLAHCESKLPHNKTELLCLQNDLLAG
ncbi:hypothetical protein, partial [Salmonella sp. SAL01998]|uniref:hypothetical protein n=1 Tax=Salmonella sp. SAL01998 TaxID=3159757 RepID=UPI0039796EE9